MGTKLKACQHFSVPIIVVSYEECNLLRESEQMITILDVIIGDAIEKGEHLKNYSKYGRLLSDAYELGGEESAEAAMLDVDFMSEGANPIKRKIQSMTKKFPYWQMQLLFPKPDEDGNLKGTFRLTFGIETIGNIMYTKELVSVDISIRQIGVFDSDPIFLFNTLGEYCLAMKTKTNLGYDRKKWIEVAEKTGMTKY